MVAETDMTGLWSVPRRQRYMPLFAGILTDSVSGALLVLLLYAQHSGWIAIGLLWERVTRAMIFAYFIRIMWQTFFFVRTDLYYVIANCFNCKNLLNDTQDFLRNQAGRVVTIFRSVDQSSIPAYERRIIHIYSIAWLAGRAV